MGFTEKKVPRATVVVMRANGTNGLAEDASPPRPAASSESSAHTDPERLNIILDADTGTARVQHSSLSVPSSFMSQKNTP